MNAQSVIAPVYPRVTIPNTEVRYVPSSIVGDEFEISVAQPQDYAASDTTTYPVLYMTDANMWFAAAVQILRFLQLPGDDALPQVLLVGIGYRTESVSRWKDLRTRDLTPTRDPERDDWKAGGAADFLRFLREELMPWVRQSYRISSDAGYCGGSLGGLFGLYTLFHEPETFQRYIIISPSIPYHNQVTFKYEEEYANRHSDLAARIFMSVGGLEQSTGSAVGMITSMQVLTERLESRRYPNLHLETVVFEEETHRSVIAAAISRGMRSIYPK